MNTWGTFRYMVDLGIVAFTVAWAGCVFLTADEPKLAAEVFAALVVWLGGVRLAMAYLERWEEKVSSDR